MSSFHPTRRDIFLVLTCFLILGLFLQFDFSLRFDSSWNGSRYNDVAWRGGRNDAPAKGKWIADVETGVRVGGMKGVSDAKLRWGEEGPIRTEVLSHAPGE